MNTEHFSNEHMEERLWEYIDGFSNQDDLPVIKKLVEENHTWRRKYNELLEINQLIHTTELEEPSMRFSKNVMEEIGRLHIAPAASSYINHRIIWGIGIFFMVLIVGFLVYGFGQIDWTTSSNTSSLPFNIRNVDYSALFNNTYINVFMMINVVLGLMLIDRVLANKRKKLYPQT
ncbi:MAG: hypothetical protein H0V30_05410 [Chitinophagaceae bacterium]|jgi:hypothetical protein|nr:hypothetical protein [Chitinophagaceae bacterium]